MSTRPAVIVISSHVVRGTVGNRAAALALEVMGFPVWTVPTITLPWHPGHGPATRIVPPTESFAAMLADLENAPWLGEVGAVLSGYLGNAEQVAPVASLVEAVKRANPLARYTLDPVLGDGDALYIPQAQAEAMRDTLLPLADIATPNGFELGWLTGHLRATQQHETLASAQALGPKLVLATSSPALREGATANLMLDGTRALVAEHTLLDGPPNGLGDLTAALLLGHILRGDSTAEALSLTTSAVAEVMAMSANAGSDELLLEQSLQSILKPRTPIATRQLMVTKRRPA
ncbi:pyridoxal kinase PdxY [Pseudahrensia aquimaris]|uniref:pyridoxal kinase n=1 Tax=Pseudahrensia aquimaris TaxID=744461 RepID=A0ABW3FM90_9HYPH